jgi:GcrA cell cycle regulator
MSANHASVNHATAVRTATIPSTTVRASAFRESPVRESPVRETWSSERVELLKQHFNAGLSCSQIAREIGVTRNAVIGKMNRLGLSRPRDATSAQQEHRRAARLAQAKMAGGLRPIGSRPKRSHVNIFAQHKMLTAAFGEPQPRAEEVPIANGCGCTLLELGREQCRWPISTPAHAVGAEDFRFCGNEPVKGLPYCIGHARIAYRPAARRHRAAG